MTISYRSVVLVGLALTAAATATAQTPNLLLSGQIGAGATYKNHQGAGGGSLKELTDNLLSSSFLRITGAEDMGGGLRAVFRLESSIAADSGNAGGPGAGGTKFFNRQSWVGIGVRDAGTVTLGRQFHAATDRAIRTLDVYNVGGSSLHVVPLALFGVNRFAGNDSRADNSIKYRFGVPGGPEFGASIAAGEGTFGRSYSTDVAYATANYAIGAAYVHFDAVAAVAGSVPEHALRTVGGNVKLGDLQLYLAWFDSSLDSTVAGRRTQDNRIIDLGVAWRVKDLATFKAAYYDDKGTSLNGLAGRDGKKTTLVVSVEYLMSRRTELYAAVFQNRFSDGYKLEAVNLAGLNRDPTKSSVSGFSAGIRHAF